MENLNSYENTLIEIWEADVSGREECVWKKIEGIGGERGWYYGTILWKTRGAVDKLLGGIGYRKGRPFGELRNGDQVDFWRVVGVDKSRKYLKLQAEMKLPGKVWITYEIKANRFFQKIEFIPNGAFGRVYWQLVKPLHYFIFTQMFRAIVK